MAMGAFKLYMRGYLNGEELVGVESSRRATSLPSPRRERLFATLSEIRPSATLARFRSTFQSLPQSHNIHLQINL